MLDRVWKIFLRGIFAVLFGFAYIILLYVIAGIGYAALINIWRV